MANTSCHRAVVGHIRKALPFFFLWVRSILQWQCLHYVTVVSRENHRQMLMSVSLCPWVIFMLCVTYTNSKLSTVNCKLYCTCKLTQMMCASFYYTRVVLYVCGGFNSPEITLSFQLQIANFILLKYHRKKTVWVCCGKLNRPTTQLLGYLNYSHTSPLCYNEPTWPHKQPVLIGCTRKDNVCIITFVFTKNDLPHYKRIIILSKARITHMHAQC